MQALTRQELKDQLKQTRKRLLRAQRVVGRYEDTWFPGRIETNEIKHARMEAKRMAEELVALETKLAHQKKYGRSQNEMRLAA